MSTCLFGLRHLRPYRRLNARPFITLPALLLVQGLLLGVVDVGATPRALLSNPRYFSYVTASMTRHARQVFALRCQRLMR